MKYRGLGLVLALALASSNGLAATCGDYVRKGEEVSTAPLTPEQIDMTRIAVATQGARVEQKRGSEAARGLAKILSHREMLSGFVSLTTTTIRETCYENPRADFDQVVENEFTSNLDAMIDAMKEVGAM